MKRALLSTSRMVTAFTKAVMQDESLDTIPRVVMDTSMLPEGEQFNYWAAHSLATRLYQPVPGPFLARADLWNLGRLHITLVEIDPFVAIRDRALVNAVEVDHLQIVQLLEGAITFEADGKTMELESPVSFIRDYSKPSAARSMRMRCLIFYISREFLEEIVGPVTFQGPLTPVPELALLRDMAMEMISFFPMAKASSAPLYATILRDLAASAMLCSGARQQTDQISLLAMAKTYVATQPPGTLSVADITAALGISRSALYRLFERDGGILAYDRIRRLRAAHRAMCNPLNTSTLGELAKRYGFRDQGALLRSFRKAFGYSPSELRENYAIMPPSTNETAPDAIRDAFDCID